MKALRKILSLILVKAIIFTLSGSIQPSIKVANVEFDNIKTVNVAVIMHSLDFPYITRLKERMENVSKGTNIKFSFFDSKNNIATQNEIIDYALNNDFDLLILNLADKKESVVEDIINKVKSKRIPVIFMYIAPQIVSKLSKFYDKAVFIMPDSKQAGIAQGKIIVDLWNTNKKALDKNGDNILQYILLRGEVNDPQTIDRSKYSISTINDSGIKTQELALVNADWLQELARTSIDNLFLKYDGSIEAIIANNDAMALGAIEALQKYGYNKGDKSKNIAVVGSDGLPKAKELIDKGFMTGTVIQDPNVEAQMFYAIGMNLINNLNPTENTNYNIVEGEIIIPYPYDIYTGKTNNP